MSDEKRAVAELQQLASAITLDAKDYEKLAMAVFAEMLVKDEAQAQLWQKRAAGFISYFEYRDGREAIAASRAFDPCWKRLRQDLYEGKRQAVIGVQLAYSYARNSGLARNPKWGGERRREVERLLLNKGIDPNASPGLDTNGPPEGAPRPVTPPEYIVPDAKLDDLPIGERLGIADGWMKLGDADRFLVNAMMADLDAHDRVVLLQKLSKETLQNRAGNRDIPPVRRDWLRDFPPQLAGVVHKLPPRAKLIIAARYDSMGSDDLHNAIRSKMVLTNDRASGEDLFKLLFSHVCSSGDSVGARAGYEVELEQGKMSFRLYLQLCERHLPKLAAQEQELAAKHERERQQQIVATMADISTDPGLEQIGERYAQFYEICNRTEFQKFVATGRGFKNTAVGTVEGLYTLVTTDPRKTAAGVYQLAKNPEIIINALDDAAVDQHEAAGGVLFELVLAAAGAGPAAKLSSANKAIRLAQASEKAADAGKVNAARKLADAAKAALEKTRTTPGGVPDREAEQAVSKALHAIETRAKLDAADAAKSARVAARTTAAAAIAAWVAQEVREALQRAVDLGPNKWAPLANRPTGKRFQRGLSGDYASGAGGYDETRRLLAGETDSKTRTVSQINDDLTPGTMTRDVSSTYSDPMAIRGRSDRIDPKKGRDPDREAGIDNLNIKDVEAIGFFPNRNTPWQWCTNYLKLIEQAKATPAPGSRGEKFVREVKETMDKAKWAENEFGRYVSNLNEVENALREVFTKYGMKE